MFDFLPKPVIKVFELIGDTIRAFVDDNAMRMAAALAFYTMFSILPAFLMALNIAGFIIGNTRAESELISRFEYLVNPQSAEYVADLVRVFSSELSDGRLSIVAIGGAVVAATAVFIELQSSLNVIWHVSYHEKNGIITWIKARVISFICVVGIGTLLLFSVVTNTILAAVSSFITGTIPIFARFQNYLNLLTQFGMVPVLLVIIYKLIPDTDIEWKDVLVGSAITSLLFLAGRYVFAWYLTSSVLQSVYGAAGSLFFLLVWVYYSAQVFYLGAEFTKVYALKYGSRCPERTSEIHPRPE